MGSREKLGMIFQEFLEYRPELKTIYVGSSDENGEPNCAPRMLIDILKPNLVFFIDFKSSKTYTNLQKNNRMSLAFMDTKTFVAFKLNGFSQLMYSGLEIELAEKKLAQIINSYHAERIIERIKGIFSDQPRELELPDDYVIIKFVAEESKETECQGSSHPLRRITDLHKRIDVLEKADDEHKKSEQKMEASRDFFKKESLKFQKKSFEDDLTGLYNRGGFIALVGQQFERAKRSGKESFLIFSDIDHLKPINDVLGHAIGDKVLVDIAEILKKSFRESDIIARIGGDEFVIALTDCSIERLELVTTRLRNNIEEYNRVGNNLYQVDISLGVVSYKPNNPATLEELLSQADKLMYQEKREKALASGA